MRRKLRVLVVEDSSDDTEVIILTLRRAGLELAWERVDTAVALAAALASGNWDAVLADYSMPGFGASAALEIVRLADPDVPFIVVSGTVGEEAAVAIMKAGANDYVFKHSLTRLAPALDREVRGAEIRRARKRADDVTRASETRYRRLFEAAQDGILIVDADSRKILDANPFLTSLLGYPREGLIGKELWEIGLFQDIDANKAAFRRLQDLGYVRYNNHPLETKDGQPIEVEFVSNIYEIDGTRVIQCNIRDVTEQKRAESLVRSSEERFRTLIATTTAIVWNTLASGELEGEQAGWATFTGQTFDQFRGWGWLTAVHPDDREHTSQVWTAAVTGRSAYQVEHRLRRADGEYRQMSVRGVPILSNGGAVREWVGVHTDVTDQRRAENRLTAQHAVVSILAHASTLREAATGLLRAVCETTGWDLGDLWVVNRPANVLSFVDLWHVEGLAVAEFRDLSRSATFGPEVGLPGHVWATGQPTWIVDITSIPNKIRATEAVRAGLRSGFGVPIRFGNEVLGVVEFFSRETRPQDEELLRMFNSLGSQIGQFIERKRTEDALRLRDRAMQAASQGLIITEPGLPDNPIVYASPGFERMTGYTAAESLGRNCRFLQGKDTDPRAVERLREAVQAAEPCTTELLNYRKDGTTFWNEMSISPVQDATGQLTHFVGVQVDVTPRRTLEEQFRQVQKMEAVGRLAAGIAHDFNNLLTIINGYSDLLLQSLPASDPSRSLVSEIFVAGERSAGLTRQLLAFSRQQVLAPRVLDLNQVVADSEKMLCRLIGEDVQLATNRGPGLWAVRADPGQVEQVLMNLAVNARDAMPRGGQLTIETRNVDLDETYIQAHADARAGPHVLLSVTDTGAGIPQEVQIRIFEPFFTTKAAGKGTGLGLATVYGIVKQSGGHIAVYSEVGVGTTFKVYLPPLEREAEASSAHSGVLSPPRGTETILLAEDEPGVRALTRHILTGCGYNVLEAVDGTDAIQVAERYPGRIHMLVTDVVMPGAGGRTVAERVAEWHPGARVLFVSGYTDDAVIRHGVLSDGVNFLQKPFSPVALAFKVRELFDHR